MTLRPCVIAIALMAASLQASAQFMAIPLGETGLFYSSKPTVILLRESPAAKAVLVTIPGGYGHFGFKADNPAPPPTYDPATSYGKVLFRLARPEHSTANFHVVLFDSPYTMPLDTSNRRSADHMTRIKDVVQFAHDRFKLPVWIMGHSNGGVSVAEFLKQIASKNQQDLIAGMIMSAPRNVTELDTPGNLPTLFVSAERDGCNNTLPSHNRKLAEKFKSLNKATTEFVAIQGGEAQGDPCHDGVHMYHKAHDELLKVIDAFATRHLVTPSQPAR